MTEFTNPYNAGARSYVEWSSIFAGAVLATALSLVLIQFGAAAGVADMETLRNTATLADYDSTKVAQRVVMTTLFVLVVQVLASMLGGYVAGRMRAPIPGASAHESDIRDGIHGVLTWATASLAVVVAVAVAGAFAQIAIHQPVEVQKTQDVLTREHTMAVLLAFGAAATSLVSAVAAWAAGTKGGDHRDNAVDYSRYLSFRIKTR